MELRIYEQTYPSQLHKTTSYLHLARHEVTICFRYLVVSERKKKHTNFATMKLVVDMVRAALLLLPFAIEVVSLRRSSQDSIPNEPNVALNGKRELQVDGMKDLQPLTCNARISAARCSTWTSVFGTRGSYATRVVIPCGQCITMDYAGGNLALLGGLEVNGKLVFPDGYKLNLTSIAVVVQGELQMTSSKPVDGVADVKFTMIGTNTSTAFTPIDVNTRACKGATTCSVGKKAIAVAGGKVTRTLTD
jgi:G8 domain